MGNGTNFSTARAPRNTRFAVRRLRVERDHALAALGEVQAARISALQREWDARREAIWAEYERQVRQLGGAADLDEAA